MKTAFGMRTANFADRPESAVMPVTASTTTLLASKAVAIAISPTTPVAVATPKLGKTGREAAAA